MHVFEVVIALLLGGAALAALARRIGTPYPALVALAGAGLALVPGTPTLVLDPELALALFVAPVLLDAAFDASPRDLLANWRQVAGLALGAVALTVAAVAVVARALVPDMPWAAAIALGAIVAPPDAAAATAVLKQLRPPHRLMVILEGESLFNDAGALLLYRLAVGATVAGVAGWTVVPTLVGVTAGSLVLGLVLSALMGRFLGRIHDVATAVIVQFCGTFGVWILAEQLHLSGILTTVAFAMASSRRAPALTAARIRIPSYAVWEVAVFVLNLLAFILIGFQLKSIVLRMNRAAWLEYVWFAAAVCAATIVARIVWVSTVAALTRRRCRREGDPSAAEPVNLSPAAAALVGWCGMRGIVTLAAALALPTGGDGVAPFPYRDLILSTAFSVVLVTLVVQGMTLRPLLTYLGLKDDGTVDREVRLARVESLRAALSTIRDPAPAGTIGLVRQRYQLQLRRAEAALEGRGGDNDEPAEAVDGPAVGARIRAAMAAERERLLALRTDGTIGDAAFQQIEEDLDRTELYLEQFLRSE